MRRILFILYYFPPAGGAGVQRGLKFLRYLPEFGWEPVVLTVPAQASYPVRDEQLLEEIPAGLVVKRSRCPEPYGLYRRMTGQSRGVDVDIVSQTGEAEPWQRRLSRWVRATLFIPDGRIGWLPFGIRDGLALVRSLGCERVFSSGPPFTCHLIGRAIANRSNLPWIADYRDPWTQATFYPRRPALARRIDKALERSCVRRAAFSVTVGNGMAAQLRESYPQVDPGRVVVIPNGYDVPEFESVPHRPPRKLVITHSGSLFYNRIPHAFFEAVEEILAESPDAAQNLRLRFAGRIDEAARARLRKPPLAGVTELRGYLSHRENLGLLRESACLLLLIGTDAQARTMVTCKVYEYLASGVPILAVGPPDGDAAALLRETGSGWIFRHDNREGIKTKLRALLDEFAHHAPTGTPHLFDLSPREKVVSRYSRRSQAGALAALFERAT